MRISSKINYACRALIELAQKSSSTKCIKIYEIYRSQKIPQKYLVQILIQLKKAEIIESVRGKEGGYYLLKQPDKIFLKNIFEIFEGGSFSQSEISKDQKLVSQHCLNDVWNELEKTIAVFIGRITIQHLVDAIRKQNRNYVYHI